jgi:hypothetical protein
MALSLTYDTAQRRLKRDRIALNVVGVDMFETGDGNIILDLATNSHLLLPARYSSSRGVYAAKPGPQLDNERDEMKRFLL